MQRINNVFGAGPMVEGAVGILAINSTAAAAFTALAPSTATGSNSNNKFYSNSINSGNYGIALIGFAAATPFVAADQGNDIGGISASTGNSILNFGGAAAASNPAAAVRTLAQYDLNVQYTTVNNNTGSGVNHESTLRGIYINTATSANATISNNTITIKGGGTSSPITAIDNASGSTAASNTININNNTIQNCTYATSTSGSFNGIFNSANAQTININFNTISNNNIGGTATNNMIINSAYIPGTLNITQNIITSNNRTGASGNQRGITYGSPTIGKIISNTIDGMSFTNIAS